MFRGSGAVCGCLGLAILGMVGFTVPLRAQTAQAGGTIKLGSGFNNPYGVAVDSSGNVFVADLTNNEVKEILAVNGVVSASSTVKIIGSGFNQPDGVAVDASGNVFVADQLNSQVKEIVAVNGVVSSSSTVNIIGSGFFFPQGVAVDTNGNVFVGDRGHNQVKEIVAVNGAVSASSIVKIIGSGFSSPCGVAVDHSGNVFVADYNNSQVKEIVAVNGAVSASSTVAIIGTGFSYPEGVAVDGSGNVFVGDYGDNAVKEIVAVNGVALASSVVNVLGSGFSGPSEVAVDSKGDVFVASPFNNSVFEILFRGHKFPTTAVGDISGALTVYFNFDTAGSLATKPYAVLTQGAPDLDFKAANTQNSDVCLGGNYYNAGAVCSVNVTFNPTKPYQRIGAVQLIGAAGTPIATYSLQGTGTGPQVTFPNNSAVTSLGSGFQTAYSVAIDGSGNVFVADGGNNAVKKIVAVNGVVSATSSVVTLPAPSTGYAVPISVAVDGSGDVFVADFDNDQVEEIVAVNGAVSATSTVVAFGVGEFNRPSSLAVDGSGNVFVASYYNTAVQEIVAVNGTVTPTSSVITLPSGSGFSGPYGVAVDSSGNVFVADTGNNAVKEIVAVDGAVTPASQVITVGSGFSGPETVAVDGSGNVFVADTGNNAVKEIVAVNGAVSASSHVITLGSRVSQPFGLALDGNGNVFVSEFGGVEEIDRSDPPALSFASTSVGFTSTDSPQSVTFQNSGNAALNAVSPGLVISGSSFAQVAGSGTPVDCTSTFSLAAGAACNLSLSFTPQSSGSASGSATFTDNALNGNSVVQTVLLAGAATQSQTITFANPGSQTVGTPLTLSASTSSGLAVSFASSTATVCSVTGNTATFLTPGQCTIVASQAGNSTYAAAANVSQTFSVAAALQSQTITFANPGSQTVGTPLTLSASTSSGLAVSFASSTATVCSVTGNTATFLAPGQCTIVASQAGNSTYAAAANVSQTFSVAAALQSQTITFANPGSQMVGTPLTLSASASSGLAVSFASSTATVCSVTGNTATFLTPGQCTIVASQAGNSTYAAAANVSQTFSVNATGTSTGPVISNIQAVTVGGNSELITWTTDQPASSLVNYGTTSLYGSASQLDTGLVTSHAVTLNNLTAATIYNFDVVSSNATSQTTTGANSTFTTGPYVGYVAFWSITNSGVTISWSTDTPGTTFVAYGTTPALGQTSPVQTSVSNSHGVQLTGLNSGTTYYFRAESTTASGSTGASTIYSFTTSGTPANPAPVITSVTVTSITNTTATVTWITDEPSTSQVNYGATSAYGSASPLDSTLVQSHSVLLTGLNAGTTYNFDVVSANLIGASTTSANSTLSTTGMVATPPVITNIQTAVTGTSVTITWTTNQAANSAVNYGTTSLYGSTEGPDSNYLTSHSVTIAGLTPGTAYNFDVVSANSASISSTSTNGSFVTTAAGVTPPNVGYVAFWGITNSGVTISWSTDLPANTELAYGTTASLGQLTPVQSALTSSHGVLLTNLASGTKYYFQAQSTGANGATGYSTIYSFTTSGMPSVPAPVISNIQAIPTGTTATITWSTDEASSSQVSYGVTSTYSSSSIPDPTLVMSHSVMLTNLTPGTIYNFAVMSANSASESSTSANSTFQTTGSAPGPAITNVAVSSITSGTAMVTWTTDQASSSVVNYGSHIYSDPTFVTNHSVLLAGLAPNTNYPFTVTSVNAPGVSSTSANSAFTTAAATAPPPVISYVAYWGITSSSVTISWSTNVPANTSLAFGTTSGVGSLSAVQTALTTSHGVTLSGLLPSTTYYFQPQSADAAGNSGSAAQVYSFTTLAGPPVITNIVTTPSSGNTATISWTTSAPTYSYVQYGPTSGNYTRYSLRTALTSSPSCILSYVPSGPTHYQLVSTDANGNQVVSQDAVFMEP